MPAAFADPTLQADDFLAVAGQQPAQGGRIVQQRDRIYGGAAADLCLHRVELPDVGFLEHRSSRTGEAHDEEREPILRNLDVRRALTA